MENYDNIDSFVNLVNKNRMIEENVRSIQEAVHREDKVFSDRIRCVNERQAYIDSRKKKLDRKDAIKKILIAGGIVGTLLTGLTANAVYGDDIAAYSQRQDETSVGIGILRNDAMLELLRNELAISDGNSYQAFKVLDNFVGDYKVLDVSDVVDVYVYSTILPEEEFEKFVKSVSFIEDGNEHYYLSFQHFLEVNGYTSENDFEKAAKDIIYEMYINGEIKDSYGSPKGAK